MPISKRNYGFNLVDDFDEGKYKDPESSEFYNEMSDLLEAHGIKAVLCTMGPVADTKLAIIEILNLGIVAGRNSQRDTNRAIGGDIYDGLVKKSLELVGSTQ